MGDSLKKWLQRAQGIKIFGKIPTGSRWQHVIDLFSTIQTNLIGIVL